MLRIDQTFDAFYIRVLKHMHMQRACGRGHEDVEDHRELSVERISIVKQR